MAAAIGYGFWVGRERPRAYFGLMLFLTGVTVGVFVAQDLLLFYAFFEAMLIPLYVLVGVWGGPGRLGATVKLLLYTMAGSLLMLAAIIVYGLKYGTFDLVDGPTSDEPLALPRVHVRVPDQGAAVPVPRLAAGLVPRGAAGGDARVLSGVIAKAGRLRDAADRDHEVPGADVVLPERGARARRGDARLRVAARVPCGRLPRRRSRTRRWPSRG